VCKTPLHSELRTAGCNTIEDTIEDFSSPLDSIACCLKLVAGQTYQPAKFSSFQLQPDATCKTLLKVSYMIDKQYAAAGNAFTAVHETV